MMTQQPILEMNLQDKKTFFAGLVSIVMLLTIAIAHGGDEPGAAAGKGKLDFQKDVAPILRRHCISCHGPEMQLADLRLDQRRYALTEGQDRDLIKPGHSADSLLVRRLTDKKLGLLMPPGFPFYPQDEVGLPQAQVKTLARWIDEGAAWPEGVVLQLDKKSAADASKATGLRAAIRAADRKAVARLLTDRSLVNVADRHGSTPLMYATLYADTSLMDLLMEHGADVNAADEGGTTALMLAAGDADKVRLLVKRGAKVDVRSEMGRTPLLIAATYAGNAEAVQLLIQSGAKVTDRDKFGETVLTSAAKRGDAKVLEALIAAGADIRASGGFQGRSPLAWAAEEGSVEAVACLLKHGAGEDPKSLNTALFNAAVRGPASAVRLLLEHKADPKVPSGFAGYTPLMGAVYSENLDTEIVKLLLEHGGDVKAKAATGDTALALARKRGHTAIVELLEQAGAKE
jgi:ankyrin repeat protein